MTKRASAKADQALAVPVEPVARLDPSGFDPSRIAQIASLIEMASVPHEDGLAGDGRRSLRYYASVGIDYFNHDHDRCRALFEDAARLVLTALQPKRVGTYPNEPLRETVREMSRSVIGDIVRREFAASGMEARQGRDAVERLDGEAATARPDAQEQPLEPKD